VVAVSCSWSPIYNEEELQNKFVQFVHKYEKRYDLNQMFHRYNIFKSNLLFVQHHNQKFAKGEVSYELSMNHLGDLTNAEYKLRLGYRNTGALRPEAEPHINNQKSLPNSIDWREKGAVNPPKDQGQCGSCWAFSATAAMETAWYLHSNNLLSLSEQLCVDCVNNGTNTCDTGGEMHDCYLQVIKEGGDESESAYPYTATSQSKCLFDDTKVVATMSAYRNVTKCTVTNNNTYHCSEADLKSAAAITVVSVGIDASQQSFQFYSGGVYNEPACNSCDNLDHGVAVVGYGTEGGSDYWWVRNSWGDGWGLSGYIKMSRNKNNQCGIACDATYPVV